MGAEGSKAPPEYDSARQIFSTQEQRLILEIFEAICQQKHSPSIGFDLKQLAAYRRHLPGSLTEHLFSYMVDVSPGESASPRSVKYYNFVIALSHILKGTASEKASFILYAAGKGSQSMSLLDLGKFMTALVETVGNVAECEAEFKTWKISKTQSIDKLVPLITQDFQDTLSTGIAIDQVVIEKWISSNALAVYIFDASFSACFPLYDPILSERKTILPQCIVLKRSEGASLLDLPSLIFLNNSTPPECRSVWRNLFNSATSGESFSVLTKSIVDKGPCIILVKDSDGFVFGAFTGMNLTLAGQFYGNETCFLFSLAPTMQIYNTSGINTNYLYFNKGQETVPNGLGMGGQFDYFGLWLNAEYGSGHSKAEPRCTTFNSPQLSSQANFTIDKLEVWGVGPDPALAVDESDADRLTSILDTNPEAKALLEMAGREQKSDGLREPDPTSQRPPET